MGTVVFISLRNIPNSGIAESFGWCTFPLYPETVPMSCQLWKLFFFFFVHSLEFSTQMIISSVDKDSFISFQSIWHSPHSCFTGEYLLDKVNGESKQPGSILTLWESFQSLTIRYNVRLDVNFLSCFLSSRGSSFLFLLCWKFLL